MTASFEFEITHFNPYSGFAVAIRPDGRDYDVEICNGEVHDVYAIGKRRKVSVDGTKIGVAIRERSEALIRERGHDINAGFFIYNGEERRYVDVQS